jgi:hypothetical protein
VKRKKGNICKRKKGDLAQRDRINPWFEDLPKDGEYRRYIHHKHVLQPFRIMR